MSAASVEETVDDVIRNVTATLLKSKLALKPKDIQAVSVIDGLEEESWQLTITLPKPAGATWDVDEVFAVRRAAVTAFDDLVIGSRLALPGQTLAAVTTDEADESDIAADETPVEGEDPTEESDEDAE